jgi:hypothetical protein
MWKIISENITLNVSPTLEDAMKFAKDYDKFVTITNGTLEFVGKFGVDEVTDPLYNGWISRKKEKMSV